MVLGMFSWHTLGPLVPIGHHLNATAYLSIVSDHVPPFMATMSPSSDGYFQQDNALKLESFQIGFLNMTMTPTFTKSQPNRASLGFGGMGASCPGRRASHKSPSTERYNPINMGQHF